MPDEEKKEVPKVYIFENGMFGHGPYGTAPYDYHMLAMADDGEILVSHICSSPSWGVYDLHERDSCHPVYVKKYGAWGLTSGAYEVVTEVPPPEVIKKYKARMGEHGAEDNPVQGS